MTHRQAGVNFGRAVQTADMLVAEISFLEFMQENEKMSESLQALGLLVGGINPEMNQGVIINYKFHLQAHPTSCITT